MIDWDGNGKLDPVDVGILEAVFDDEEETPQKIKESKKMGCCLLPILIFVIVLVIPMVIKIVENNYLENEIAIIYLKIM